MTNTYNVYCDESAHQAHDHHRAMVVGAVWCPLAKAGEITSRIREIKTAHGMAPDFEVKWTKVSPAGVALYRDLLDSFFDDDDLHFRALVVPDKVMLWHDEIGQDQDAWSSALYFDLLKAIFRPDARYRVYLDAKDTRSAFKVANLREVLARGVYEFSPEVVERVQTVRAREVAILQLADLLIGAVSYANRGLAGSPAKVALVERLRERSGYTLQRTTLLSRRQGQRLRLVSRCRLSLMECPAWLPAMAPVEGRPEQVIPHLYRLFLADFEATPRVFGEVPVRWDRRSVPGQVGAGLRAGVLAPDLPFRSADEDAAIRPTSGGATALAGPAAGERDRSRRPGLGVPRGPRAAPDVRLAGAVGLRLGPRDGRQAERYRRGARHRVLRRWAGDGAGVSAEVPAAGAITAIAAPCGTAKDLLLRMADEAMAMVGGRTCAVNAADEPAALM